jgi:hypothetical protein
MNITGIGATFESVFSDLVDVVLNVSTNAHMVSLMGISLMIHGQNG